MSLSPIPELRPYRGSDRDWVIASHVDHYIAQEGFSADFAAAVVGALDSLEARRGERGSDYRIAEREGRRLGCLFLAPDAPDAGRLRLFFLSQECRGRGLGRRMLRSVLDDAKASGLRRVRVSTYDRHEAACRLYRSLGFRMESEADVRAFGLQMRQLDFEIEFADQRASP